MKDSKFIELLNLYVDHQISPDDAALLEAEVRGNPERRQVYRQYCQIQKACTQLGEAFRTEAPAPVSAPQIAEFKPRRTFGLAAYVGALGAVAACIAVVMVARSRVQPAAGIAAPVAQQQIVAPQPTQVASHVATRPALQPVLGPRFLTLREQNAELADAATASYPVAIGDWMNEVRLTSMDTISIDDLRFDGRAPLPAGSRTNHTVRPFQGKVEMAAVRFQK